MKPDYFLIEPDRLADSPFQPRKHYDTAALQELADNIRQVGILEPILARPITQLGVDTPAGADLEIIVGHRRRRAGVMAGLEIVPVIIRAMTDAEVRIAQISENLQRQDVSAIEEGEALRASVASRDHTVQTLAKALGKSVGYVYGRMKLAELTGEARDLVASGLVPAEVGLLIARLPAVLHQQALDHVAPLKSDRTDGEVVVARDPRPLREARRLLAQSSLMPKIALARFDADDNLLLDGVLGCRLCDNNSDNIAGEPAGHCYDRTCFVQKTRAACEIELATLRNAGWTITGEPYDGSWRAIQLVEDRIAAKRIEHPSIIPLQRASIVTGHDGLPKVLRYVISAEFEHWWKLNILRPLETADTPSTAAQATGVRGTVQAPALDQDEGTAPTVATPRDRSDEAPVTLPATDAAAYYDALTRRIVDGILDCGRDRRTEDELLYVAAGLLSTAPRVARRLGLEMVFAPHSDSDWDKTLDMMRGMDAGKLGRIALACAVEGVISWTGRGVYFARYSAGAEALLRDLALRYAPGSGEESSRAKGAEGQDQSGLAAGEDDEDDAPLTGVEKVFVDAGLKARPHANRAPYRDPITGETWSGRGLKPLWLRQQLDAGRSLSDFAASTAPSSDAEAS